MTPLEQDVLGGLLIYLGIAAALVPFAWTTMKRSEQVTDLHDRRSPRHIDIILAVATVLVVITWPLSLLARYAHPPKDRP